MLMRLRYIGNHEGLYKLDKVYYATVRQEGIKIHTSVQMDNHGWYHHDILPDLNTFLKNWKILSIDKKVANVRVHHK